MIICPNCGRENADTVRLCSFCDHELRPSNAISCPNCGKLNAPENEICPHCGTRLKESAVQPEGGELAADPWSMEGFGEEEERQPEEAAPDVTLPAGRLATRPDVPSAPAEETPVADELPDPFGDIKPATPRPPAAGTGSSGADDLRDLFSGLMDEPASGAAPGQDEPDWLTDSLKPAADELPDEETMPMSRAEPAEEMPDWFTDRVVKEEEEEKPEPADDLRDWFSAQAEEEGERESPSPDIEPEGDLLDRLAVEGEPGPQAAPADDLRDWLTGEAEAPAHAAPASDLPDWLAGEGEPGPQAAPAGDLPDWLAGEGEPGLQAARAGDLPDWLAGEPRAEGQAAPPAEPVSDEEVPAWLAGDMAEELEVEEAAPLAQMDESPPAPERPDDDLDWLTGEIITPSEGVPEAEPLSDVPDWLQQAPAVPIGRSEPEKPSVVPDDWLAEALGTPAEDELAGPPPAESAPGAVTDDWLSEALGTPSGEEGTAEPAASGAPLFDEEMPDWLKAASVRARTGSLPPLLSQEESEGEPPSPPVEATDWPLEGSDEEEMPDWLQAAHVKAQTGALPPLPGGEDDEETHEWLASAFGTSEAPPKDREEMPLWMKAQTGGLPTGSPKAREGETAESEAQPTFDSGLPGGDLSEDMPDWLQAMQPEGLEAIEGVLPTIPGPSAEASPFEGTLLDWLDAESAPIEEAIGEAEAEAEARAEEMPQPEPVDLESAELPDWLRALRPEEAQTAVAQAVPAVAPMAPQVVRARLENLRAVHIPGVFDSDADTREESVGPLKGVVGVVAAAPVIAALQRPISSPTGPAVEVDSAQISLLQRIFSAEAEAPPVETATGLRRLLGRALVTLLLLAAVVTPIVGGILPFEAPQTIEAAAADAARSLGGLGPSPSILLVFEYDPSRQGEMDAEAEAMVGALMDHDARLYAVSTQPTGPAIAQNVLESLAAQHGYVYGEDYLNLGYVSGEAAGVRGLVTGVTPGVVSPLAFDYQGTPTSFGSGRLYDLDLDMMVVLAGRPEAVRVWVEQAGNPSGIPMVAAVSAGVEPMVLPYYHQGRQLRGVVSGLSGAASFALATQGPELPPSLEARWNAQVGAALATALVILVGIVLRVTRVAGTRPAQEIS